MKLDNMPEVTQLVSDNIGILWSYTSRPWLAPFLHSTIALYVQEEYTQIPLPNLTSP